MKVLIAEDEPISNLYLKNTLVRWGYEVVSTKNGSEAWEVLRGSNPQWIAILDWEMPKMKGIEVCQKNKGGFQDKHRHLCHPHYRQGSGRRY
ncbi:response regulator [Methanosarcina horonobensis]|uniref:response regulator n=1 Tax=Methanosarcina horonobensis TaxID=418008 RepID=UPI000B02A8FC|nr:response regulator [Methanosarcina horonobensis]